jgi:hypothetical protein
MRATDRAPILERIATAAALANTSDSADKVGKWSEIEWNLRETLRPTREERLSIERETVRFQQIFNQDWEARKKAARELQAGTKSGL